MLQQLPQDYTAVVTGAGGGIGRAIVAALQADPRAGRIIAVSRQSAEAVTDDDRLITLRADLTTPGARTVLANELAGAPVHLLFNTIGILHDATLTPEKRLEDLDAETLSASFHVNAITPMLVIQALQASLKGRHPAIIASLSARVGSIADNGFGGWYGYRASKAAHNMLLRTAAIELARYNPQAIVLCLHPGTTDTQLSKPFQARVPEGKLFTPAFVAERLLAVMGERTPAESGTFWDWAGKPIPW